MEKIYQPIVKEKTEKLIDALDESGFFVDYQIEDKRFAKEYFLDKLTDKFIIGELDSENDSLFNETEFETCLQEIVVGSLLEELRDKGMINSYEDDDKGELFFLTKKGKDYLKDRQSPSQD